MGAMLPDSQRHARFNQIPRMNKSLEVLSKVNLLPVLAAWQLMMYVDPGDVSKLASMKVLESGRPSIFFENAL